MIRISRFASIALVLIAAQATAGARADLATFTGGLKGLDGTFVQKVYDPKGRLKETASGRVAVAAPRLFRWEYKKPHPQLIVADGKQVWVFDPDLKQATVRPQGAEEQNSPLAVLIDPGQIDRRFTVAEEPAKGGLSWLNLTPKGQGGDVGFRTARLGFAGDGLQRMEVVDALGQRTEITFSEWKRNPRFPAGVFRYAPGKGVDVVGQR